MSLNTFLEDISHGPVKMLTTLLERSNHTYIAASN